MGNEVLTLREFIDKYFDGSLKTFAETQGVQPPQVTQWINKNFIVVDGKMYSQRRELLR